MPSHTTARTVNGDCQEKTRSCPGSRGPSRYSLFKGDIEDVCPGDNPGGTEVCNLLGRQPDPALPQSPPRQNHAGARAEPIFAPRREELNLERVF